MQGLVKFIYSVLFIIFVMTLAEKQESTTWQKAMPNEYIPHYSYTEHPQTENTIGHLCNEQIAIPIHIASEVSSYHPHHSKPKCLYTIEKQSRNSTHIILNHRIAFHRSSIHLHAIDYYIYTLEHILI